VRRAKSAALVLGAAALVGFGVFLLLVPTSGAAEFCYSLLAFRVPCEGGVAMTAGVIAAALVVLSLWVMSRRRTA
jgi:hypothetical protein